MHGPRITFFRNRHLVENLYGLTVLETPRDIAFSKQRTEQVALSVHSDISVAVIATYLASRAVNPKWGIVSRGCKGVGEVLRSPGREASARSSGSSPSECVWSSGWIGGGAWTCRTDGTCSSRTYDTHTPSQMHVVR